KKEPWSAADRGQMSRRKFLRRSAGWAAGTALTGGLLTPTSGAPTKKTLPKPNKSGVEHVVVVMMENRSFDHLLGWLAGANGRQAGLNFTDKNGVVHSTKPLAPD